jgi:hypothetical protein
VTSSSTSVLTQKPNEAYPSLAPQRVHTDAENAPCSSNAKKTAARKA